MAAKTYIKGGYWHKTKTTLASKNELDLVKFFRDTANALKVGFYDACCPTSNLTYPVSYSLALNEVVYYNGTAFVPVDAANDHIPVAVNSTAAITAAQLSPGVISSTSVAAVTGTLPTASLLATEIGATQGTTFDFVIDNSAGANIFTVAVNTGITAVTAVITGGATLTVAAGAIGIFKLYFTSATVAKLARIV